MSKKKFMTKRMLKELDVSMADLEYPVFPQGFWDDDDDWWCDPDNWWYYDCNLSDQSLSRKLEYPSSTAELSLVRFVELLALLGIKSAKDPS